VRLQAARWREEPAAGAEPASGRLRAAK
jgi:hypothetical protein